MVKILAYLESPELPSDFSFTEALRQHLVATESGDEVDLSRYATPSQQGPLSSCFRAGTPILLGDLTERPIEEVGVGNLVRSLDGRSHKVLSTFERKYSGPMYELKVQGWRYPVEMTEEHPVAVVENIHTRAKFREFKAGELKWVPAKELKPGDYVVFPDLKQEVVTTEIDVAKYIGHLGLVLTETTVRTEMSQKSSGIPRHIKLTQDFCRLVGLFLAEGSYAKMNGSLCGVTFSFHRKEVELHNFVVEALEEIFGLKSVMESSDLKPNCTAIRCSNVNIALFMHGLCGEYSLHKTLDSIFFQAPLESRVALLQGWYEGDGSHQPVRTHSTKGVKRWAVAMDGTTSSEALHRGLSYLLLTCGIKPSTLARKKADHQNASAGIISLYSKDVIKVMPHFQTRLDEFGMKVGGGQWTKKHDLGFLCRIKEIKVTEAVDLPVYNFEVADTNSYIVNGIAVHNCAGNATADAAEIVAAVEEEAKALSEGRFPKPTVQLSRLFVYSMSRMLHDLDSDGQTDLNLDEGTFVRTCLDVLARFGICREELWPHLTSMVSVAPSLKAMREAVGHRIHSYYRIKETGQDRLEAIQAALRAKHPVVFGTKVSKAFLENSGPAVEDVPSQIEGGHAMIIVGFTADGRYKVKNSWGPGWRDNGFAYLTSEYIMWDQTTDLWVLTGSATFKQ